MPLVKRVQIATDAAGPQLIGRTGFIQSADLGADVYFVVLDDPYIWLPDGTEGIAEQVVVSRVAFIFLDPPER